MLTTRQSVQMCLTFFVAFHVLIEIDHIYSETLARDSGLLHTVHKPLTVVKHKKDIPWKSRSKYHKMIRILYKFLRYIYISCYYYFIPYFINFIPFFLPTINYEVTSKEDVPNH